MSYSRQEVQDITDWVLDPLEVEVSNRINSTGIYFFRDRANQLVRAITKTPGHRFHTFFFKCLANSIKEHRNKKLGYMDEETMVELIRLGGLSDQANIILFKLSLSSDKYDIFKNLVPSINKLDSVTLTPYKDEILHTLSTIPVIEDKFRKDVVDNVCSKLNHSYNKKNKTSFDEWSLQYLCQWLLNPYFPAPANVPLISVKSIHNFFNLLLNSKYENDQDHFLSFFCSAIQTAVYSSVIVTEDNFSLLIETVSRFQHQIDHHILLTLFERSVKSKNETLIRTMLESVKTMPRDELINKRMELFQTLTDSSVISLKDDFAIILNRIIRPDNDPIEA